MRKRGLLCWVMLALALALPLGWFVLKPDVGPPQSSYRGKTTRAWSRELRQWQPMFEVWRPGGRGHTIWGREPSTLEKSFGLLRHTRREDQWHLPLHDGDPESIPVLTELLSDPDPKVRQIAIQGLSYVGTPAVSAIPALMEALDDEDDEIRRDAEQALRWIDLDIANQVGVESSMPLPIRGSR